MRILVLSFVVLIALCNEALCNWVKEMENPGLYEGDMVLTPTQTELVKKGKFAFSSTNKQSKLWPNAEVPYEISYDLAREPEAMREINEAFKQYHKYTCLKFVKRTSQRGYISLYAGGGCSSMVGYAGGKQRISLSKGCWWRTTVMHEIGHALGFHHEQSRPDRDSFVTILTHNIHSSTLFNFKKQSYGDVDSRNTPYDYRSMMHYSWNAFGKDQKMTIKTKDPKQQYEIGQDEGFSHIDVVQLNRMYNCKGTYAKLPPYVPPPPGCYDLGGACAKGAFAGQCTDRKWKSYMHSKCRRSCGLCGTGPRPTGKPVTYPPYTQPPSRAPPSKGPGGNCKDRVVDCARLGRHRCNDSNRAWRDYMRRSCRNYCNLC